MNVQVLVSVAPAVSVDVAAIVNVLELLETASVQTAVPHTTKVPTAAVTAAFPFEGVEINPPSVTIERVSPVPGAAIVP